MKLEETVPSASIPSSIGEAALVRPRRTPVTVWIAMAFVAMAIVCAAFGRQIAPIHPTSRTCFWDSPPSAEHWAGTDLLGRDVLENDRRGSNRVVGPAVVAAGAFAIATILGLWGGYVGGATDCLVMRWVDFMFALPGPLIAIVIVGVVGRGSGRPSRS